jgi:hypothetical protein
MTGRSRADHKSARKWAALALVLILPFVGSCLFGPSEKAPKKTAPACKSLTDKDNVLYNLELAYKTANFDCYIDLLHEKYSFHLQERDVIQLGLPEYWTREEDSLITRNMFLAAKGQHPDSTRNLSKLEIEISDGAWVAVAEFDGQPCDDCWETTREYYLELYFASGDMILMANDQAKFIVVPVTEDGQKRYKLVRLDDIERAP